MDNLLEEVKILFDQQLDTDSLLSLSKALQAEFKQHLISSPQCMLPSFNYHLPTGQEQGLYLALEVGGSNLWMALVELRGRGHGTDSMRIRHPLSWPIDNSVKQLQGHAFFDWLAERIEEMLMLEAENMTGNTEPLRIGVAWSFPIDQTSIRSGNVLGMGKGFYCSNAVKGHDLGDLITGAYERAKLNIQLDAIVNDSSSALLARAYIDPATRLAVILGTGMNAAMHLPITSLHPSKLARRPPPEDPSVTHVLTNTELSMYGKGIFPATRWDEYLNDHHTLPNYQPFEYLVAGGYMGEIVRLILIEATKKAILFRGKLPSSLAMPYILNTKTLALIENDTSYDLKDTISLLHQYHPSIHKPTPRDAYFIRQTVRSVTKRSIAYFATGIHALASLSQELERDASLRDDLDRISIGCDGSVINKYPMYMERTQETLDQMLMTGAPDGKSVILEKTQDSAVLGAGIAAALAANAHSSSV